MATNNAVNVGLSGSTGTGSFVGSINASITSPSLSTPILTTPQVITSINDTNGNVVFNMSPTVSSVNYFTVANAATTGSPTMTAGGSDTNIILTLNGKGTGGVMIKGTSTNNNASSGYVGEFVNSQILNASAVTAAATGTAFNVTSISLTAGDWDVWGNIRINKGSVSDQAYHGWISSTSATVPDGSLIVIVAPETALNGLGFVVPYIRFSLSATTTVYLSSRCFYTGTAPTVSGGINARRAR